MLLIKSIDLISIDFSVVFDEFSSQIGERTISFSFRSFSSSFGRFEIGKVKFSLFVELKFCFSFFFRDKKKGNFLLGFVEKTRRVNLSAGQTRSDRCQRAENIFHFIFALVFSAIVTQSTSGVFIKFLLGFGIIATTFENVFFRQWKKFRISDASNIGRSSIRSVDVQNSDFAKKISGSETRQNVVVLTEKENFRFQRSTFRRLTFFAASNSDENQQNQKWSKRDIVFVLFLFSIRKLSHQTKRQSVASCSLVFFLINKRHSISVVISMLNDEPISFSSRLFYSSWPELVDFS